MSIGHIGWGEEIGPIGATFEDGYRVAEIVDASQRSGRSRAIEDVKFRTLPAV